MARRFRRVGRGRRAKVPPRPAQPFALHPFESKVELLGGRTKVPTVLMTREAFSRMWHFVDIAQEEVGWLGTVEETQAGDFLITEVFLLKQEVSSTQTDLSPEGQAALAEELLQGRPDGMEVVNKLLFWGHSHVNMGTTPSFQDEKQMEQFRENGCPWFIRGILNKLGRMEFTVFLWEERMKISDVPWSIYEPASGEVRQAIEADFKSKVSRKRYVQPTVVVYAGGEQPHHPEAYAAFGSDVERYCVAKRGLDDGEGGEAVVTRRPPFQGEEGDSNER